MEWNFYTASAVLAGIVLVVAALAGPIVGTPKERVNIFLFGAFSIGYGIWVAKQTSGIYFFSVVPLAGAVAIVVRVAQRLLTQGRGTNTGGVSLRPRAAVPGIVPAAQSAAQIANANRAAASAGATPAQAPASPRTYMLRAAQPQNVREAVARSSEFFNPAFALLKWDPQLTEFRRSKMNLTWPIKSGLPVLDDDEDFRASWNGHVRLKVAVGKDLCPTTIAPNILWVSAFEGSGPIVLTDRRLLGFVRAGESIFGGIGEDPAQGVALWSFDLQRCASAAAETTGVGPAVVASSDDPASHLTLSSLVDIGGAATSPAAAAAQINALIERSSLRVEPA